MNYKQSSFLNVYGMRNTCHQYQDLLRHFQPIYNQIYQRSSGIIGFDHGPDCNDHSKKNDSLQYCILHYICL